MQSRSVACPGQSRSLRRAERRRPKPSVPTATVPGRARRRETGPTTILERLTLRLSEARAREHLRGNFVRLDGEVVTDPDAPADWRLYLCPPGR